ncbi:dihydroorotate dehydrogenase-like protein [Bacteroidales bacterium OttesenSCG-928-B11]|nr:dihydroorotate dehydrogenase-like protein [Bacteroidales bacterium OttesenSCG-928-B11]MDL2326683.1 dihydroorotate dehydrogenase-like protein [Bacteroidales bacterium OttesenSCG-928-A14]
MLDLSIKYMGLTLPSPLILGSSGLSNQIENLIKAEDAGFGAVVLQSVFEEQIKNEIEMTYKSGSSVRHSQSYAYISHYQQKASIDKYLQLIKTAKETLSIPVIASINCFSTEGWMQYAKRMEEAGADALEINYFDMPINFDKEGKMYKASYFKLVDELKKRLDIPIALKTSHYFTDLAHFMQQLSYTGLESLVLFNRFHSPDIDIDKMEFSMTNKLSRSEELSNTLRWTGILSKHLRSDLCATTGCHDADGLIKLILAGADAVQATSIFYEKGIEYGRTMIEGLSRWMEKKGYKTIQQFKAKLNYKNIEDPAVYFRIQFMKYMES